MTTHDTIGLRIKEARYRRRWTQFQLARLVGCSESQIAKIETGRIRAHGELQEALSRELGISLRALNSERFDQLLDLGRAGNAEAIGDLFREFGYRFGEDTP
jgi:transcriptional regulator with XRE-family HTH domain